jgi:hypothetical protein
MKNTRNDKQHSEVRSSTRTSGQSHHPVRRILVAVRRGWDDVTYLDKRFFERPF